MTLFLNLRATAVGGAVLDPMLYEGDGTTVPLALKPLSATQAAERTRARDVVFVTHGFNVPMRDGACVLGRLEALLALPSRFCVIAILWPGDFWLPVVNYPFAGGIAIDCGRRVANYCDATLKQASSLSFVSHSLGARVVLEAVRAIRRPARSLCLLAAAVNDDALLAEYASAFANTAVTSVLASRRDHVLALAYPVGDVVADLLHFDHKPWRLALGLTGPPAPVGAMVPPWLIADGSAYDHGDYLPSGDPTVPLAADGKWLAVAAFIRRALGGEPQTWPS